MSKNSITISDENLGLYGFSCFYYKGEVVPTDGFWDREIELAKGQTSSPSKATFSIPENLLICLKRHEKITTCPNFEIDNVVDPTAAIKLLSERAGWNQTLEDLHSMCAQDAQGGFLARYVFQNQKIVLGSGFSLPIGDDLAWIGMILVHPELRRQGIARSIMHRCVSHARIVQQKSIVGLDATPLGKQVYDALGFKDSFLIWRSILSTSVTIQESSRFDLDPMQQIDAQNYLSAKNYQERSALIEEISSLPGSYNLQATSDGEICGIALSRPGRSRPFIGTLIADSPEFAKELIAGILSHWKEAGYEDVFMDIPEWHLNKGSIFIVGKVDIPGAKTQLTVEPIRSFVRMYQLIAPDEKPGADATGMSDDLIESTIEGFDRTATFMNKEKNELVPMMYGTNGPEWS